MAETPTIPAPSSSLGSECPRNGADVHLHALIVEDEAKSSRYLSKLVELEGFSTSTAASLESARASLKSRVPDLLLVDLMLPDGNGLDLLKDIENRSSLEVVVITGHASVDTAVEALHLRACDYLTKPIDTHRLKTILRNMLQIRRLTDEIDDLRTRLRDVGHFHGLVGSSPPMQRVYDLLSKVAPTETTVLLMGESGTGKELAVRAIHKLSRRRDMPFLGVNCGAIPLTLIESELFGHEQGSFTSANGLHLGYFERANGGTLFLDEITEMPPELQVKLLRVLETGTFHRVGGDKELTTDVRVIAATNRRPEQAILEGKLREDLYYRLNVFSLHLPPLVERGDDIEVLALYFLGELNKREGTMKRISPEVLTLFRNYRWPGNVRELKNVLERAFILSGPEILPESLPQPIQSQSADVVNDCLRFAVGTPLAEMERQAIDAALKRFQGNKRKTASALGINVRTLYNRLSAQNQPSGGLGAAEHENGKADLSEAR